MNMNVIIGVLIPFLGTTLGAGMVFLIRNEIKVNMQTVLSGFAAGVMVAASVWSLLIPAIEMSESLGKFAFTPAALGFMAGIFFLLILDKTIPHLHAKNDKPEGIPAAIKKSTMLVLAVTLHNIPEGMAVGVVFAGMLSQNSSITLAGAFALSIGIAIQNFPEGAIISMPLRATGKSRGKAFLSGMLSGIVEPIGAVVTIWLSGFLTPAMPFLLAFAAGAMIYVVVEELIPESSQSEHSDIGTISFAIGFVVMMILDVALS